MSNLDLADKDGFILINSASAPEAGLASQVAAYPIMGAGCLVRTMTVASELDPMATVDRGIFAEHVVLVPGVNIYRNMRTGELKISAPAYIEDDWAWVFDVKHLHQMVEDDRAAARATEAETAV